jgi:uncharacterized LabA/DUF88 family protein
MSTNRTRVYVDGFNLYYGAFREGPFGAYKWLNLVAFCQDILSRGHHVDMLRYFTARVKPSQGDPGAPARQAAYIQALRTLPEATIHMGTFSTHPKVRPVADPGAHCQPAVEVLITEEKGSDVNLATYLLLDAFDDTFDTAVVVSDDSDLLEPLTLVKRRFGKRLAVIRIRTGRGSVFRDVADVVYDANRLRYYSQNQFPPTLHAASGRAINKPASW